MVEGSQKKMDEFHFLPPVLFCDFFSKRLLTSFIPLFLFPFSHELSPQKDGSIHEDSAVRSTSLKS